MPATAPTISKVWNFIIGCWLWRLSRPGSRCQTATEIVTNALFFGNWRLARWLSAISSGTRRDSCNRSFAVGAVADTADEKVGTMADEQLVVLAPLDEFEVISFHVWTSRKASRTSWSLQVPAAHGLSPQPQDRCGHFLQANDGTEFFLDGEAGEFVAAAPLGGEDLR